MKFALILLIAVVLAGWCPAARAQNTLPTSSAKFGDSSIKRGAVIQLKEGTALKFQDRFFRGARPNEEFVVLEVREDKLTVFVSGTDKAGSEIALSAPLPAATTSTHPDVEIASRISLAADQNYYARALALVDNLPTKRGEAISAINRMQSAVAALAVARSATIAAQAEVKRLAMSKSASSTLRSWKERAARDATASQGMEKQAMAEKEGATKALHIAVAVSVPLSAPVAVDVEKLRANAVAAAKAGKFPDALAAKTLTIEQIAAKANEPQNFVAVLIADAKRFPFTAFTYALKTKDWVTATSLATSVTGTIEERIGLTEGSAFIEGLSDSPLSWVVMAQAEAGDFDGAGQTCNKIPSIPEQARARGMIITRLAANGDFERADGYLAVFELRDAQRLPKDDHDKMKKGNYEGMSKDGQNFALEYWSSIRMIIQGLAAKGKIQEAIGYINGIKDYDTALALASLASIVEAKVAFGDPDALSFGREIANQYKKYVPFARFSIVMAQAKGFSKAGQRSLALEIIANALADAPKDDEKASLLKVLPVF